MCKKLIKKYRVSVVPSGWSGFNSSCASKRMGASASEEFKASVAFVVYGRLPVAIKWCSGTLHWISEGAVLFLRNSAGMCGSGVTSGTGSFAGAVNCTHRVSGIVSFGKHNRHMHPPAFPLWHVNECWWICLRIIMSVRRCSKAAILCTLHCLSPGWWSIEGSVQLWGQSGGIASEYCTFCALNSATAPGTTKRVK